MIWTVHVLLAHACLIVLWLSLDYGLRQGCKLISLCAITTQPTFAGDICTKLTCKQQEQVVHMLIMS